VFCRLPDDTQSAPEITQRLFIEHNMYIKHCSGKTLKDSDRYIRIASRTETENCALVDSLAELINSKKMGLSS
jgi:threonine-phosphate decarboxylase